MKKLMATFVVLGGLQALGMGEARPETSTQPLRYLAWLDGDFQSEYQPQRELARRRLKRWRGGVPDESDTDKYLAYLAVLDASGEYRQAEKKIKAYLVNHPKEKRAVFLLGSHYQRRQRKELAEYFFLQLEKDRDFVWKSLLFNNLGKIALAENRKERAITYFEKAADADPPIAAPYVNLGAIYLRSASYDDAERMFLRATHIDDHFEDAVVGLGATLEAKGKYKRAAEVYQDFRDDHPDALSVIYNLAILLGDRLGKKQEAAELMLQYIKRGGRESVRAQKRMKKWR